MNKQFCLCADDFGLTESINQAIIILVENKRLQAVSCMTQSPLWQSASTEVLAFQDTLDIGLHLNFTQTFQNNYYSSLKNFMLQTWAYRINKIQVEAILDEQWQLFINATGRYPDFVDGHQHVHQFPIVREVLVEFLQKKNFKGWIRNLANTIFTPNNKFKTWALPQLGAKKLQVACQQYGIRQNQTFAGVYDFGIDTPYAHYMQAWMNSAPADTCTLVMCHPSLENYKAPDVIADARAQEFKYLNSGQFMEDCERFGITLNRISDYGKKYDQ